MSIPPTNATGSSFGLSSSVNNVQDETISVMELNDDTLHINSLPDEVFVEIFSYLKVLDLCKIKGVCRRWYMLARCPVLWKHVDVMFSEKIPCKRKSAAKLVQMLPTCTTHIKLNFDKGYYLKEPLNFEKFSYTLSKKCPNLLSLSLKSVELPMSLSSVIDLCVRFLQNLHELIINFSNFDKKRLKSSGGGLSKIQVLDLLGCLDIGVNNLIFLKLPCLKRLNLARTLIGDSWLWPPGGSVSFLNKLEVLNLGDTLVSSVTFQTLRNHGFHLTTLIMCLTQIKDDDLSFTDSVHAFPHLKMVCFQNCHYLTSAGIVSFITSCPSVEAVYVNEEVSDFLEGHPDSVRNKCKSHIAKLCYYFPRATHCLH